MQNSVRRGIGRLTAVAPKSENSREVGRGVHHARTLKRENLHFLLFPDY